MSKGIVRVKPTITSRPHMGQVILTEVDPNGLNLVQGSPVDFSDNPPLTVNVGDIVECTLKSKTECTVTRVVGTTVMAQGTVTQIQIKITAESNPNPFNVKVGSKLDFNIDSLMGTLKDDDTVECLPFSATRCDVTNILTHA